MLSETGCQGTGQYADMGGKIHNGITLRANIPFACINASVRLYYEALKKDINFDFIEARIRAAGAIQCTVIAQTEKKSKIVQRQALDFGPEARTISLPVIDLLSLPRNGSLFLSLRSLGGNSYAYGFRWLGKVAADKANLGERIVLLRSSGNVALTLDRLGALADTLATMQPALLKRTLFMVYESQQETGQYARESLPDGLRLLVLRGPESGISRNVSLLASLALEAQVPDNAISEIIAVDAEASLDAETLLRHDSFVAARKPNIISTAALFSAASPATLVHYDVFSGKQAKASQQTPVSRIAWEEKDLPWHRVYLDKPSPDNQARFLGVYRAPEFAPFTFVSFPYELLKESGAPLPIFAAADDMEIFLRCMARGARLVVNPNLQIWHDIAREPDREFYGLLQGLIIKCVYEQTEKKDLYTGSLEKLVRLARAGNRVSLGMYRLALEKFTQGPAWMTPEAIHVEYGNIAIQLGGIIAEYSSSAPGAVMESLAACIEQLQKIARDFDGLRAVWRDFIGRFRHREFWNGIFGDSSLAVISRQFVSAAGNEIQTAAKPASPGQDAEAKEKAALYAKLPQGFTIRGYLDANPDVKEAGVDPVQHWFNYGQYENRTF